MLIKICFGLLVIKISVGLNGLVVEIFVLGFLGFGLMFLSGCLCLYLIICCLVCICWLVMLAVLCVGFL